MSNSIVQAKCVELETLTDFFINLEYEKVDNKTFGTYRSRSFNQKIKKYLQLDEIKESLKSIDRSKLNYIYILGKDSMLHPEFNHILRLCLMVAPVTIYTDGSCINDKKARFLKKVEDEGEKELVFKVFINNCDEKLNDEISGRGSFRKSMHAITSLAKYGFNPILAIKCYVEDFVSQKNGFVELLHNYSLEMDEINFCNIPILDDDCDVDIRKNSLLDSSLPVYDCMSSRVLSKSGVYNCPSLVNDYRGWSGATVSDCNKKCYLETEYCINCQNCGSKIFSNNWV